MTEEWRRSFGTGATFSFGLRNSLRRLPHGAKINAMSRGQKPTLRYANETDGAAVGSYHLRCWQTSYRGLIADSVIDAMTLNANQERWASFFAADPEKSGFQHVVAVIDGVAVGHISVAPSRDLSQAGEVAAAYVDPDHQRGGVGAELLLTGQRILRNRGFERAVLWTVTGNDPAINFYERHGWQLDGMTKVEIEGDAEIHEVRLSIDLTVLATHIDANRTFWDEQAPNYIAAGERAWASEPSWGIFGVPDTDIGVFPDVAGRDVIELGCGTAYVSAWCARAGARSVVGLDNSADQLATAKRLQAEHELAFPLLWGDAEHVPLVDASFDVAISEYGAAIWCDPNRWISEASRLLRSGGTLVFLGNSLLSILAANDFETQAATHELQRPQRDIHQLRWPDTDATEFHVSHGEMIRILRTNNFEVLDLIELYAPEGASTKYTFLDAAWAAKWPHEEIWVARKR